MILPACMVEIDETEEMQLPHKSGFWSDVVGAEHVAGWRQETIVDLPNTKRTCTHPPCFFSIF